jgi:hypothetical protein
MWIKIERRKVKSERVKKERDIRSSTVQYAFGYVVCDALPM